MENPNNYIALFLETCDIIEMGKILNDVICLWPLLFLLTTKSWLNFEFECKLIHYMGQLSKAFLYKYSLYRETSKL